MDRFNFAALGERLKIGGERLKSGGAEMGRKVGGKMKEILQGPTQEAKMVDEATSDRMEEPNWGLNLKICGLLSSEELNGSEVVKAIKKKIASKSIVSQRLSLELLEACAINCDKIFSELASEKVLNEMVRLIDNSQTHYNNRQKALQLIEAWGQSDDLAYLPIFRQTYMNLKAKNKPVPTQDDENYSSLLFNSEVGYDDHAVVPPERYPYPNMDQQNTDQGAPAYHGESISVEEKKEILVVARNSMEILSSMLSSEVQDKPIKDELTLSMLEKCRESQLFIQRIIESTDGDEPLFFEALNLHEELQQVLSKYEEVMHAGQPHNEQSLDDSGTAARPEEACPAGETEVEAVERGAPAVGDGETTGEHKNAAERND